MSTIDQIQKLLEEPDAASKILELVNKPSAMQRYLASDKGKLARKRSNDKYRAKLKYTATEEDVQKQIDRLRDGEKLQWKIMELWRDFCENEGHHPTWMQYKEILDGIDGVSPGPLYRL